jgi:hypothetical protein
VNEDELLPTAHPEQAIPFDAPKIPEVKLDHRGDLCSFEAIIADRDLKAPGLSSLAPIVRSADVKGQESVALEGWGLRAIAEGFAAMELSDEDRLARGFPDVRCALRIRPPFGSLAFGEPKSRSCHGRSIMLLNTFQLIALQSLSRIVVGVVRLSTNKGYFRQEASPEFMA